MAAWVGPDRRYARPVSAEIPEQEEALLARVRDPSAAFDHPRTVVQRVAERRDVQIGHVGQVLGKAGVNIKFMNVAPLEFGAPGHGDNEALMILKTDEAPGPEAIKGLIGDEGVVEATVIVL